MIFSSLISPKFDWIQIEVTSACNAACIYCPHAVYRDSWTSQHLSLNTFRKIQPAFSKSGLVHLQGWGEPFLHPDFFEMVRLAKKSGCRVGTTTNGMLLDKEKIAQLIETGVDVIAFSLAGVDEGNDRIRQGTNLKRVLRAIQELHVEKERRRVDKPVIHIAYLILRSKSDDLARLPTLLKGKGITQVVLSTLDFVASRALEGESFNLITSPKDAAFLSLLKDTAKEADELGIMLHSPLLRPEGQKGGCSENVGNALFISSEGAVTPCVFSNLQVGDVSYVRSGREIPYQRMVFGNVKEKFLFAIWKEKSYRAFRRSLAQTQNLPGLCEGCPKFFIPSLRRHPLLSPER